MMAISRPENKRLERQKTIGEVHSWEKPETPQDLGADFLNCQQPSGSPPAGFPHARSEAKQPCSKPGKSTSGNLHDARQSKSGSGFARLRSGFSDLASRSGGPGENHSGCSVPARLRMRLAGHMRHVHGAPRVPSRCRCPRLGRCCAPGPPARRRGRSR